MQHGVSPENGGRNMKKRSRLKKGLAILLTAAMVAGLLPGVGTMKVSAAESEGSTTSSTVTFEATAGTKGASESENYDKLIDGKYSSDESSDWSKWCVTNFKTATTSEVGSITDGAYIIFAASEPIFVKGYSIVTGNDNANTGCGGRNPKTWTLYGCNDVTANSKTGRNSASWVEIKSVTDDTDLEDKNYTKYDYVLSDPTSTNYQYFKLEITATKGSNIMQMSEFILDYSTCNHSWQDTEKILTQPVPRAAMTFINVQYVAGRRRFRIASLQTDIPG